MMLLQSATASAATVISAFASTELRSTSGCATFASLSCASSFAFSSSAAGRAHGFLLEEEIDLWLR
jgi:hypothetical protein